MIELNYRDSRPIYEQIKTCIKKMVVEKALGPNEQLPSVRSLAIKLSINPNTIQRAYNELENEGYVYSIPGKGSFVSPEVRQDEEKREELKKKFLEIVTELNYMGVSYEELLTMIKEKTLR